MIWFKNTRGQKDAMLTFALVAFVVVLMKLLVSGLNVNIKGHEIHFGSIDASVVAALLAPTLGAYVARRHSETKYGKKSSEEEEEPETKHGRKDS